MKIIIEIPEVSISGKNSLIYIQGNSFQYSRPCDKYHGLQSGFSQDGKEKHDRLMFHCDNIAKEVVEMIEEELI